MYVQLCAGKFQILNWRHIVHMITLHTVRGEPNQYFENYIFAIFYFKLREALNCEKKDFLWNPFIKWWPPPPSPFYEVPIYFFFNHFLIEKKDDLKVV